MRNKVMFLSPYIARGLAAAKCGAVVSGEGFLKGLDAKLNALRKS
jgi:hypothetical protein